MHLRLAECVDNHTERERILATLMDWLRIPSISAQPDHAADVRRSDTFTAELMADAGLEHIEVLETGPVVGTGRSGLPSVYADHLHAGPGAPTVLIYGHHDVQPVDPLEEWTSPPFEPVVVDGELRARGAIADKGQVLFQIEAARGLLARGGALPVNVKFLVEGEEEVGSPNFEALLEASCDRLACDVVVVSDTDMWAPDVPSVCVGMRGLLAFGVQVRTAKADLHSGLFGEAVPNSAHLIAAMVTTLHDADGRVALPGFYDDVRPLSEAEEASLRTIPVDEGAWQRMAGVERLVGEAGRSLLERIWTRPTCDVTGISVGYAGPGVKTIVPAQGRFTVTFRLVPAQRPERVTRAFEAWVAARVPDDRFHAPNERMVMDQFWKGLLAAGELLHELGELHV